MRYPRSHGRARPAELFGGGLISSMVASEAALDIGRRMVLLGRELCTHMDTQGPFVALCEAEAACLFSAERHSLQPGQLEKGHPIGKGGSGVVFRCAALELELSSLATTATAARLKPPLHFTAPSPSPILNPHRSPSPPPPWPPLPSSSRRCPPATGAHGLAASTSMPSSRCIRCRATVRARCHRCAALRARQQALLGASLLGLAIELHPLSSLTMSSPRWRRQRQRSTSWTHMLNYRRPPAGSGSGSDARLGMAVSCPWHGRLLPWHGRARVCLLHLTAKHTWQLGAARH